MSIKLLTDLSSGYDKFKIKRNSPGTDFGTKARGEHRNVEIGGIKYGPDMRPRASSLSILSLIVVEFLRVLGEFLQNMGDRGRV